MSEPTVEMVREAYRSAAAAMLACLNEDVDILKEITATVDAESLASALMSIGVMLLHHGFEEPEEVMQDIIMNFATADEDSWKVIAENSESF